VNLCRAGPAVEAVWCGVVNLMERGAESGRAVGRVRWRCGGGCWLGIHFLQPTTPRLSSVGIRGCVCMHCVLGSLGVSVASVG
jgi:hypothetical protein